MSKWQISYCRSRFGCCCPSSEQWTARHSTHHLRTRFVKCSGIFENLLWIVTSLSFLCNTFVIKYQIKVTIILTVIFISLLPITLLLYLCIHTAVARWTFRTVHMLVWSLFSQWQILSHPKISTYPPGLLHSLLNKVVATEWKIGFRFSIGVEAGWSCSERSWLFPLHWILIFTHKSCNVLSITRPCSTKYN